MLQSFPPNCYTRIFTKIKAETIIKSCITFFAKQNDVEKVSKKIQKSFDNFRHNFDSLGQCLSSIVFRTYLATPEPFSLIKDAIWLVAAATSSIPYESIGV